MRLLSCFLVCAISLSGCAKFLEKFSRQEEGYTQVTFGKPSGGTNPLVALSGQLMIYVVSVDGGTTKTFRFDSESSANSGASVAIKNGSYRFYALGFSDSAMQTDVRCGRANLGQSIQLAGGNATIAIDVSRADCALNEFSTNADQVNASTGFEPTDFLSCVSGLDLSGFSDGSSCGGGGNEGDINHVSSLKVELVGYETSNGLPSEGEANRPGISSACLRGDGKPASNSAFTLADTNAPAVFTSSNGIFFGSTTGIRRSTDNGSSFTQVLAGVNVQKIHGEGSYMVAGTSGSGIYYSNDGGASWTQSSLSAGNFFGVFVASGTLAFAGMSTGQFYISTNGGANWTTPSQPFSSGAIESIFYDSSTSSIYISGYDGSNAMVSRSTDNGSSFTNLWSNVAGTDATVVKRIGGYLYWGAQNGLYRSPNADGSTPTQYCSTGCTNAGFLPGNAVQDVIVSDSNLYVATSAGIGVSVANDPDSVSAWENYGSTELGGSFVNVFGLSFYDGKLWQGTSGTANSARVSNSRGSGTAFPISDRPIVPAGGSISLPLATRVVVYNDASCQSPRRSYFFPKGVAGAITASASSTARFASGAEAQTKLFLRDF